MLYMSAHTNFNSTLVRLKEVFSDKTLFCQYSFQFHIGTIKRKIYIGSGKYHTPNFNSTLVRLKAKEAGMNSLNFLDFNSTLVRLKASTPEPIDGKLLFQFHIGTIKRLPADCCVALTPEFQFHIGTIKSLRLYKL